MTWHSLNPSRDQVEKWLKELYELVCRHHDVIDAHTVDFYTCNHWNNIIPKIWKEEMNMLINTNFDDVTSFPSSPSPNIGSLHNLLYAVRRYSIPMEWNHESVSIPDHLVQFGMTTKKSHEVGNFSLYVAQLLSSRLKINQVLDMGSGKGYLSQHLALCHGLRVVGVDSQPTNTIGANRRNQKVYKAWKSTSKSHKLLTQQEKHKLTVAGKDDDINKSPVTEIATESFDLARLFSDESDHRLFAEEDKEKEKEESPSTGHDEDVEEKGGGGRREEREEKICAINQIEKEGHSEEEEKEEKEEEEKEEEEVVEEEVEEEEVVDLEKETMDTTTSLEHSKFEIIQERLEEMISEESTTRRSDRSSFTPLTRTITTHGCCHGDSLTNTDNPVEEELDGRGGGGQSSIFEAAERESGGRFSAERPTCLVGLHTCGDLASMALRIFLQHSQLRAVCVVGCCYHHITETTDVVPSEHEGSEAFVGFPMSKYLQSSSAFIGRTGRMLACQSSSRVSLISSGAALESVFRRAVLQVILKRNYPAIFDKRSKTLIVGRFRKSPKSFEDYVFRSLERLGLDKNKVKPEEAIAVYREFEPEKEHLATHLKLRGVLASCIESLIILDRLLFLQEQELGLEDITLVQLFNPAISPRCIAISATKL